LVSLYRSVASRVCCREGQQDYEEVLDLEGAAHFSSLISFLRVFSPSWMSISAMGMFVRPDHVRIFSHAFNRPVQHPAAARCG